MTADGAMVISGGRDSNDNFLDDIHMLLLAQKRWVQVSFGNLSSKKMARTVIPRAMHKMRKITV